MGLDFRKKSRRDRMMRSKSFETQEVREIGWKETGRVERLSHLVDENNRRCLSDGRKELQSPGEIEDVKKKIHARARKMI